MLKSEPVKALEAFAQQHKETQGKFTIGDEKVRPTYFYDDGETVLLLICDAETQRLHAAAGPRDPEGYRLDGPRGDHVEAEGDEE